MIDLETILENIEEEINSIKNKVENSIECYTFVRRSREEQKFNLKLERMCREDLFQIYKERCLNIKNDMVNLFKLSDNIFIPDEYLDNIGTRISEKLDNILNSIEAFIREGMFL